MWAKPMMATGLWRDAGQLVHPNDEDGLGRPAQHLHAGQSATHIAGPDLLTKDSDDDDERRRRVAWGVDVEGKASIGPG